MKKEVWKDIEGYEGVYQVSSFGRVKSLFRLVNSRSVARRPIKERILVFGVNPLGYKRVVLSVGCKTKTFQVHRLVASAFLPNTENKPQVNHINGNPSDNSLSNLEWATRSENQLHSVRVLGHKRFPPHASGANHYLSKAVLQFDLNSTLIKEWDSLTDAANGLNRSISGIVNAANFSKKRSLPNEAYGYLWAYKNAV